MHRQIEDTYLSQAVVIGERVRDDYAGRDRREDEVHV